MSPIILVDVEKWHKSMSVNVDGVLLCYKYAALQMVKQGEGGRLIGMCICPSLLHVPLGYSLILSRSVFGPRKERCDLPCGQQNSLHIDIFVKMRGYCAVLCLQICRPWDNAMRWHDLPTEELQSLRLVRASSVRSCRTSYYCQYLRSRCCGHRDE